MGHQIDFQKPRRRPVPLIVGTYQNPFSHRPAYAGVRAGCLRWADGFQETVQGGGAGHQQPLTHPRVQIEVAMALHGLHQVG